MAEIVFENCRISNFEGLMTLTLDWVILHTAVHHSSTSTYTPNFTEIKETFCGWTDTQTVETGFIRSDLTEHRKDYDSSYIGVVLSFNSSLDIDCHFPVTAVTTACHNIIIQCTPRPAGRLRVRPKTLQLIALHSLSLGTTLSGPDIWNTDSHTTLIQYLSC